MEQPGSLMRAKRWPNWWRRVLIWARKANVIATL